MIKTASVWFVYAYMLHKYTEGTPMTNLCVYQLAIICIRISYDRQDSLHVSVSDSSLHTTIWASVCKVWGLTTNKTSSTRNGFACCWHKCYVIGSSLSPSAAPPTPPPLRPAPHSWRMGTRQTTYPIQIILPPALLYQQLCFILKWIYIYIFGDENSSLKGRTVYGRSVPYPNPIWLYIYIEREIDIHKEVAVMRLTGVELSPPVICSVGSSQRARCTTCITRNWWFSCIFHVHN